MKKACKISKEWHKNDQIAAKVIDFRKPKYIEFRCLLISQRSPYIFYLSSLPIYEWIKKLRNNKYKTYPRLKVQSLKLNASFIKPCWK